jgi:hypothetical protein
MMILVSGATATVRRFRHRPGIGVLFVPRGRNDPASSLWPGAVWAADNGAFSAFDASAFVTMLEKLRGVPGCRFVAAPDVVGDAAQTLRLFAQWAPVIRSLGFPVALVGQDGLTVADVPWSQIDALFIGGSTDWKLSRAAAQLVAYGQARGKWTHLGRTNTRRRLHHASRIGCDSVDGTAFSRWPDRYIPKALGWLEPLPLFPDHART